LNISSIIGMGESTFEERQVTSGRLIADTYLSCKEFLRFRFMKFGKFSSLQLEFFFAERKTIS
jgi:hypothetical protein